MLIRLINSSLIVAFIGALLSILLIGGGYFLFKPSLPEINLVDEDALQIPLKVYSADGVLIGEFGDQKRRTIEFKDIPNNLKNAFLAAAWKTNLEVRPEEDWKELKGRAIS